jgi:hypothetical protein
MKKLGFLLLLVLMLGIASGTSFAQFENTYYFVTYYSNANTAGAPDATVRIINDGDTGTNLWAAFYVFDDSQELTECCACFVSPDGLLSESVNKELTANPLTGPPLKTRGAIKVISSATSDPTATVPVAGLRGTATHIQKAGATTFAVTETELSDSNLAAGEQVLLQELCFFDGLLSGKPCICTPEDHDF